MLAERWKVDRFLPAGAGLAAVAAFALVTSRQTRQWQDDLSLWSHAVAVTSKNYRAEDHLGVALSDRGRLDDAIRHYQAAVRIWPDYPEGHNNLGTARMDQRNYDDAIHEFSEASRAKPQMPTFHYNLGVAFSAKGDTASAIREIRKASALDATSTQFRDALRTLGDSID